MPGDIKKIKFFIRINGVPCHTLDDLQQNFYLQDVMALHCQGILQRWLIALGHKEEAAALPETDAVEDKVATGQKLAEILCPNFDKNSLRAALDALQFEIFAAQQIEMVKQGEKKRSEFVELYHASFEELLCLASERRDDFEFLCQTAICLVEDYWNLVEENIEKFSTRLFSDAPCLFFPLLALGKFSGDGYGEKIREDLSQHVERKLSSGDSGTWYESICAVSDKAAEETLESGSRLVDPLNDTRTGLMNVLRIYQKKYADDDQGTYEIKPGNHFFHRVEKQIDSWDDVVQDSSVKTMVIHLDMSAHVRPVGTREDYTHIDIKKFKVFSGLEYKSTSSSPLMIYIELPECLAKVIPIYALPE